MYNDVYRFKETFIAQVQLKEYIKLRDTIYEVEPKEEECFRFSRLLNFKVSSVLVTGLVCSMKATAEPLS